MKIKYSENFRDAVQNLSPEAKRELKKKLEIMIENPRHPSLRSKKIEGTDDIFEASIYMDIRMTWQYISAGILLRSLGEHDRTLKNP